MSTPELSFTLIENALDYTLSAAEHARCDDRRSLKYALLHLASAVELVLKARLEEEHWSLLFADVDKANEDDLKSGDFRSVDFDAAVGRLSGVAAICIPREDMRHLQYLRKLRNRAQHFAIVVPREEVVSVLARGCNFIMEFCQSELALGLPATAELRRWRHLQEQREPQPGQKAADAAEDVLVRIMQHLVEFEAFVRHRLDTIAAQLEDANDLVECPRCWQQTLKIGSERPCCPFCGYETDPHTLAQEMGEFALEDACPECGEETLCFILYNNEVGVDYCTSCSYVKRSVPPS